MRSYVPESLRSWHRYRSAFGQPSRRCCMSPKSWRAPRPAEWTAFTVDVDLFDFTLRLCCVATESVYAVVGRHWVGAAARSGQERQRERRQESTRRLMRHVVLCWMARRLLCIRLIVLIERSVLLRRLWPCVACVGTEVPLRFRYVEFERRPERRVIAWVKWPASHCRYACLAK